VYVTTHPVAASMFAAMAPIKGDVAVYEVEPIGELAHDPDCSDPGLSFECESARVIGIVRTMGEAERMATMVATISGDDQ
jgi:hypothetical protein